MQNAMSTTTLNMLDNFPDASIIIAKYKQLMDDDRLSLVELIDEKIVAIPTTTVWPDYVSEAFLKHVIDRANFKVATIWSQMLTGINKSFLTTLMGSHAINMEFSESGMRSAIHAFSRKYHKKIFNQILLNQKDIVFSALSDTASEKLIPTESSKKMVQTSAIINHDRDDNKISICQISGICPPRIHAAMCPLKTTKICAEEIDPAAVAAAIAAAAAAASERPVPFMTNIMEEIKMLETMVRKDASLLKMMSTFERNIMELFWQMRVCIPELTVGMVRPGSPFDPNSQRINLTDPAMRKFAHLPPEQLVVRLCCYPPLYQMRDNKIANSTPDVPATVIIAPIITSNPKPK
jgi:hypothetical protein